MDLEKVTLNEIRRIASPAKPSSRINILSPTSRQLLSLQNTSTPVKES